LPPAREEDLAARGWKQKELDELRIGELIRHIESDDPREPLVPLVDAS
jgi:sulfur transfer complex TusBCD TusB component (DsrH family)